MRLAMGFGNAWFLKVAGHLEKSQQMSWLHLSSKMLLGSRPRLFWPSSIRVLHFATEPQTWPTPENGEGKALRNPLVENTLCVPANCLYATDTVTWSKMDNSMAAAIWQ